MRSLETATFGAGCFWGVESTFRCVRGVVSTSVGYMGGTLARPTYEDVCHRDTGHAEVVQLQFDPLAVTYGQLLDIFWSNHDPTTLNRQGPDVGTQYRSVIFFHNAGQEEAALTSMDRWRPRFGQPVVTQVVEAQPFYRAEEYHQQYLEKRGLQHCRL